MFTNEQLKAMIRQEVISEQYPYSEQDDQALKNYLKAILAELERANIRCKVEPDHFGSGYASYMQWFVYEESGVQVEEDRFTRTEYIKGLHVLISNLAPVIVIGNADQSSSYILKTGAYSSGGQSVMCKPEDITVEPARQQLAEQLERLFMKYQFTILRKEDLEAPLPFDADIPTIWREKREYLVWDAVFYWED